MMQIRIIKGPLTQELLQQLSDLYGQVDAKYADAAFCSYLFNQNPSGFSYHAFALAEERAVGHIALIPMPICTPEGDKLSFKAEAFYILPDFRDDWVEIEHDALPIGLALPRALYDFALNDEQPVIHLLADDEIGKIHTFAGCRDVPVYAEESFLILNPRVYLNRTSNLAKKLLIMLITVYQKLRINALKVFLIKESFTGQVQRSGNGPDNFSRDLGKNSQQWSINLTPEFCKWFFASEYIQTYASGASKDVEQHSNAAEADYIVVKQSEYPSRPTEIISFFSAQNSAIHLSLMLQSVIKDAQKNKAGSIIFKRFDGQNTQQFFTKELKKWGFLTKKSRVFCFVNSINEYYARAENMAYNQFFYIQF